MTTSAAPPTSIQEISHAAATNDGQTDCYAASWHGGSVESAAAGRGGQRTEFCRAAGDAGGSAVELAGESGAGAAHESREAARQRLYRRHRLPCRPWAG